MGKIRVSTLGSEEEQEIRNKQKTRREEKKKRVQAAKVHISGMKGGERVKSVGAESEEEIERLAKLTEEVEKDQAEGIKIGEKPEKKKKFKVRERSPRYKQAAMKVDQGKIYPISEALPLLRNISLTSFDATVELHINTTEKGLRGAVTLPHGTGKEVRVEIANTTTIDKIIEKVEKGTIDFDALIAHPQVMPQLAKIARYLGPKGLMPNPKAGTISQTPEKVAEKLRGGEIQWKTESDFPLIHMRLGKLSFKDNQLEENFKTLIKAIGETKIKAITLKSTMSPGIKVQVE
ncbi:50S ribosomal protein L1 [Candidatus Gottesmanbacteria bacterium]|nr:50S ribosomal protein L1 [Candidatus Gottesmanbacteria bacterium]